MCAYKNDLFECRTASCQLVYWSKSPGKPYFIIYYQKRHKTCSILKCQNLLTRIWEWKHPGLNNVNIIKYPGKYKKLKENHFKEQKAYTLSNNKSNTWNSSPWKIKLGKLLQGHSEQPMQFINNFLFSYRKLILSGGSHCRPPRIFNKATIHNPLWLPLTFQL